MGTDADPIQEAQRPHQEDRSQRASPLPPTKRGCDDTSERDRAAGPFQTGAELYIFHEVNLRKAVDLLEDVTAYEHGLVAGGDAAKAAAAADDFDKASQEFDELHEVWEEVEGTVKSTDSDIYERIETAQGLIKDGAETKKADRVATGAADQAAAVQDFIAANQ